MWPFRDERIDTFDAKWIAHKKRIAEIDVEIVASRKRLAAMFKHQEDILTPLCIAHGLPVPKHYDPTIMWTLKDV